MKNNLGFFSSYGIEYVFDYLGESRIKQKIEELSNKPTMGITLNSFTYGETEYSFFPGTGVLHLFELLIQWFNDIEFGCFLYENSKKYNQDNYFDGGLLKENWEKHIDSMNMMIESDPERKDTWESNKLNPYWKEYHFFYSTFSKKLKEANRQKEILEIDFIGTYNINKNKLLGKIVLDLKTRRKPLTGQYLLYREGSVWYNLFPKKESLDNMHYEFTKDKCLYTLVVDKVNGKAEIKLTETNSYNNQFITLLNGVDLETTIKGFIKNYVGNFSKITSRIKNDYYFNNNVLSNGVMWYIMEYYEDRGLKNEANEIAKLNNSFLDIWREIPTNDEI